MLSNRNDTFANMRIEPETGKGLKDYLFQNREIALPGVGLFKILHIDQYLSDNDTIIHPPFVKVRFHGLQKNVDEDVDLTKYYYNGKVEKQMEGHFQSLINDMLNFGEAKVKGLGKLRMSKSGELTFVPGDLLDVDSKFLPVIDTQNFSQVKASGTRIPPIDTKLKAPATPINEFKPSQSVKVASDSIRARPIKRHKTNRSGLIGITITGVLLLIASFLLCKHCVLSDNKEAQDIQEGLMSLPSVDPSIDAMAGIIERNTTSSSISTNPPLVTDPAQLSEKTYTLVLGSFQRDENAQRMGERLKKDGLEVLMMPYSDFTRVVVHINCAESDLQSNLNKLSVKYQSKPWSLNVLEDI